MMDLAIYCADIGSVKAGNFGWTRARGDHPAPVLDHRSDILQLVAHVAADLNAGCRVALGFECPLFVPFPDDPLALTSARPGEGNRAWSTSAGACALATGLTESVWILDRIRKAVTQPPPAYLDWAPFSSAPAGLFVWEAFVTDRAKVASHWGDAEAAVLCFKSLLPNPHLHNALRATRVRSLIGAALLQTGWVSDSSMLDSPCLVIKAGAA
jgi:hypothetical protein